MLFCGKKIQECLAYFSCCFQYFSAFETEPLSLPKLGAVLNQPDYAAGVYFLSSKAE